MLKELLFEKRKSNIHGEGLFAIRDIKFGTCIVDWADSKKITEEEYLKGGHALTGVRYMHAVFLTGEIDDTDYFNHSNTPNVLYVFGVGYAWRDIAKDEELTMDYRFLCSDKEIDVVRGYPWRLAFKKTIKNLKTCSFLRGRGPVFG